MADWGDCYTSTSSKLWISERWWVFVVPVQASTDFLANLRLEQASSEQERVERKAILFDALVKQSILQCLYGVTKLGFKVDFSQQRRLSLSSRISFEFSSSLLCATWNRVSNSSSGLSSFSSNFQPVTDRQDFRPATSFSIICSVESWFTFHSTTR